jgi:hypothetical protein
MDYERQAGFAGRRDMPAETALLALARAVIAEIVESGFADRDNLGAACALHQVRGRHIRLFIRVVRMRADRAKYIIVRAGNLLDVGEFLDPRADGDHPPDAFSAGARNDCVALGGEIRKIEMTMAVDQHGQAAPSSGST